IQSTLSIKHQISCALPTRVGFSELQTAGLPTRLVTTSTRSQERTYLQPPAPPRCLRESRSALLLQVSTATPAATSLRVPVSTTGTWVWPRPLLSPSALVFSYASTPLILSTTRST